MRQLLVLIFVAVGLWPLGVHGWPGGPDDDPRDHMPNDPGYDGQWNLWSWIPEEWLDTPGFHHEEAHLGTGIHADRAWQVTPGDRRVIVAVLDSGAYWDNKDLVAKYHLNRGELAGCMPEGVLDAAADADPFDVNGSGWFDIRDYLALYWPTPPGDGHLAAQHDVADAALRAAHPDWDVNGNGVLEPEDLILRCSDGIDDDHNGYVDDISGWDFFDDDNNAYDQNRYGHGNGEAKDSVGEGHNGIGDIGVCPQCTALMVRVGDSFVTDSNMFGAGVLFAVDSGASVIQEALGTINNTRLSREAIDYAYKNNVVVIASAADELSFHHNFPGTNNHTVYVHAIMHDKPSADKSTTFLNFNNCTNYGMQLMLSTSGTGCSSEAVGISAGHAGIVYSAALKADLDPPLSAEEAKQLMTMTADDIAVNPNDDDPTRFYSGPGWDWHFGYGRNNVRASVDAIMEARIPPEVDILDPLWFQVLYPERTPTVSITGRINTRTDGHPPRHESVDWVLEYAPGVEVVDGFITIAEGSTAGLEGELAQWNLAEVALDLDARLEDAHQNAVTLRLRATATLADGSTVVGEMRKGVHLDRDPDLHAGFPRYMGASLESSPVFADLDGDGRQELIVVTTDGFVHVIGCDGEDLAPFPVALDLRATHDPNDPGNHLTACAFRDDKAGCRATRGQMTHEVREAVMMAPAVGDLEGDGTLEIVVSSWDGHVYVFEHDGSRRPGWPTSVDPSLAQPDPDHIVESGFFAAPILYDLDGQPGLEILAAAMDQHLYAWHADGSPMAPYPVRVGSVPGVGERIICTPAVGDIDGDGLAEIATGTNEVYGSGGSYNEAFAYVLDAESGTIAEGWPQSLYGLEVYVLPLVGRGVPTNPMLADLDYDGTLEISFDTLTTQGWFFDHDGQIHRKMNNQVFGPLSDSQDSPAYILMNNGALGTIDPDNGLDFVKGTAGFDFALAFAGGGERGYFDHHVSGWDTETGEMLEGFPRVMEDWQFFNTPAIADIDGDNDAEVIIGSAGYLVHAFNYRGEEPQGWPKQTGGWIIASANLGDLDGDGHFDVSISTRNGWLYVWRTSGPVTGMLEWNGYGHDPHNTGNYELPVAPYGRGEEGAGSDCLMETPPPSEPSPEPPESGGCAAGVVTPGGGAILLALGWLLMARRRRR